ncbi:MAG: phosphate ABC transporter permease subunit PstC [Candidatus Saliniplasma sp.]
MPKETEKVISRSTKDKIVRAIFFGIATFSILIISFIFIFLFIRAYPAIEELGMGLLSSEWNVSRNEFGLFPALYGSVFVAIGALLVSVPLGLGAAIYLSEIASNKVRMILKPMIELLAGIPSIVYGFIGAILLGRFLYDTFGMRGVKSFFAAMLILGIMALPIIISLSDDAMKSVPKDMKDASLALGATKWQTIRKVTIPGAISGISSAVIMGMGRAIGETMAVMLIIGSVMKMPVPFFNIFDSGNTLTALIAVHMGESHGIIISVLFTAGIMLFTIVAIMSIISDILQTRTKEKFEGKR